MRIRLTYTRTDDWEVSTSVEDMRKYVEEHPEEFDERDPFPVRIEGRSDASYAAEVSCWIRDNPEIASLMGNGELTYTGYVNMGTVHVN